MDTSLSVWHGSGADVRESVAIVPYDVECAEQFHCCWLNSEFDFELILPDVLTFAAS